VFKTDCKFHLPRNTTELADAIRKNGYTGNLKVRQPVAEVVVLDPCVPDVSTLGGGTDVPVILGQHFDDNGTPAVEILSGLGEGDTVVTP
jgi:hypothetical protein